MYRRILVCYDGSDGSKDALLEAIALAKQLGAKLTALWVDDFMLHYTETLGEMRGEKKRAQRFFLRIAKEIEAIAEEHEMEIAVEYGFGHATQMIVKAAKSQKHDLIVLGHSGHSRFRGRLLGHTADQVSENALCSVLIVRPRKRKSRAT